MLKKSGGLILCARLMLQSHGLFADDLPLDWDDRSYSDVPLTLDELKTWSSGLDEFFLTAMTRARHRIEAVKGYKKVDHALTGETVPLDLIKLLESVQSVLASYEPLSLQCIADMCRLTNFEALIRLLAPVRSLFPITLAASSSDSSAAAPPAATLVFPSSATVSVYHKSVKDWYLSANRRMDSDELIYHLPAEENHRRMAERCFQQLLEKKSEDAAGPADAATNSSAATEGLEKIRSKHNFIV